MAMSGELTELVPKLEALILAIPDFPKPGILFRDIMPIFTSPKLVEELCRRVAAHAKSSHPQITHVTGLEARGFLFGPQIAYHMDIPFVPIRKKGKLPGAVVAATYEKEYGKDTVEIQSGAITSSSKVLIVDDLLATGGTMRAACDLVQKTGATVAEIFCLIELTDLKGKSVLPSDIPIYTLVKY